MASIFALHRPKRGVALTLISQGPIRLAHMIREMQSLPDFMLQQPLLSRVYKWYLDSFREMVELPQIEVDKVLCRLHQMRVE